MGRDNVYAFVEAAAQAKSTEPDAVLAAVNSFKDKEFVTGKPHDVGGPAGSRTRTCSLVEMKGTEFTFLKQFRPENTPAP